MQFEDDLSRRTFLIFIVYRILWTSWICGLTLSHFWKVLSDIISDISVILFSIFLQVFQLYIYIYTLYETVFQFFYILFHFFILVASQLGDFLLPYL